MLGDVAVVHFGAVDELDELDKQDGRTDVEVVVNAKASLLPFDPFFHVSTDSREAARLRVRLAHLQNEAQEKAQACQAELELRLEICTLETESDRQVKLR